MSWTSISNNTVDQMPQHFPDAKVNFKYWLKCWQPKGHRIVMPVFALGHLPNLWNPLWVEGLLAATLKPQRIKAKKNKQGRTVIQNTGYEKSNDSRWWCGLLIKHVNLARTRPWANLGHQKRREKLGLYGVRWCGSVTERLASMPGALDLKKEERSVQ